jgi:hypothetical protein
MLLMPRFLALLVPALAIAIACHDVGAHISEPADVKMASQPTESGGEDTIIEAAFRWHIAQLAHSARAEEVYFLTDAQDADPSDAFMARFSDITWPHLKRKSASELNRKDLWFYDRETGARGTILRVKEIRHGPDSSVSVIVEAWSGRNSLERATLILEPHDMPWIVRDVRDQSLISY